MPLFMDRHDLTAATAVDVAAAHVLDLEVQERYGVRYMTYWFDYDRQSAFCLATGPDREAVVGVHKESHGLIPSEIIEVDRQAVDRLLGPLVEHAPGEAYVDTAFRAILFTDISGSTALTQRLGDAAAMQVLATHDRVVRDALHLHSGTEVKHTGDGLMASFRSVVDAVSCAITIQRNLASRLASVVGEEEAVAVRIGIAAGEPVTSDGDLFGAAVQLAARLADRAAPGAIVVSGPVRDLAIGKDFTFGKPRQVRLKGFDEAVRSFEVAWRAEAPA
jgi:class 3 adenylate cyclase